MAVYNVFLAALFYPTTRCGIRRSPSSPANPQQSLCPSWPSIQPTSQPAPFSFSTCCALTSQGQLSGPHGIWGSSLHQEPKPQVPVSLNSSPPQLGSLFSPVLAALSEKHPRLNEYQHQDTNVNIHRVHNII